MEATVTAPSSLDQLCINTIRTLSIDAIQKANSGHPGAPLALAPLAYRIFTKHLKHNPQAPDWADRDRFVLSCGHASMLLYSILHLSGYAVSLDDLKSFRQLHSPTAGHPERGEVPGVEFTTGPLGQGLSSAVGMALAERMLAARYNREDSKIINHTTWVIASDGDLMEGVSAESASLAGHLGLGNLIVFWDDNKITIDGTTDISFTENVAARFDSYGWQTLYIDDVNDLEAIDNAVSVARDETSKPTLIVTKSHIGYASPLQDTSKVHGAPLGDSNVAATKQALSWLEDENFVVPNDVKESFIQLQQDWSDSYAKWQEKWASYESLNSDLAEQFKRTQAGELPQGWAEQLLATSFEDASAEATRQTSGRAIELLTAAIPELVGGSADLAASNNTDIPNTSSVTADNYLGRILHFGIREHAMGAIVNGIVAHGGLRAFGATFLIFSDYMRPAIRLSALMGLPSIWVFTHDSVYLGEDGPTHQPIEHLASLRAIPNLLVIRPADANETFAAWKIAVEQKTRPTLLALSRQKLEPLRYGDGSRLNGPQVERGGYILREASSSTPSLILIATGSEVELALKAADILEEDGTPTRVVSMPCTELFMEQDSSWRDAVLPPSIRARVTVEAAASFGWERFAGDLGEIVGIDRFGLSAPGDQAAEALGISVDGIISAAHRTLASIHGAQ